jgi:WD40 repeat protein
MKSSWRNTVATALVLAAVVFAGGIANSESSDPEEEGIRLLLRRFSDTEPAQQDAAANSLLLIGKPALHGLRNLEQSQNQDLAKRAAELAREIELRASGPIQIQSAVFTSDGKHFAYTSKHSTFFGKEAASRTFVLVREIASETDVVCLRGTPPNVSRLDLSPDGRHLLVPGWIRDGTKPSEEDYWIGIWDWRQGKLLKRLRGHTGGIATALYFPSGRDIVSAGLDGALRFWNAETGVETAKIDAHDRWVCHVQVSPDGKHVLSCGDDNLIKLWDVATRTELARFSTKTRVSQMAYSPDGSWVACLEAGIGKRLQNKQWVNVDGAILILDMNARKVHKRIDATRSFLYSVAIEEGGKRTLTGDEDHRLTLWDTESGREIAHTTLQRQTVRAVSFMKNPLLAWAIDDGANIRKWELPP